MRIVPDPPVEVMTPEGPGEALSYESGSVLVRVGGGERVFPVGSVSEVPFSASGPGDSPENPNSDSERGIFRVGGYDPTTKAAVLVASEGQPVFGLETAVHAGSKAEFRRGDVVRTPDGLTWRVSSANAEWSAIVRLRAPGPPVREVVPTGTLVKVGDVCPGHAVDMMSRRCIHCGLTDRAILAAGEKYVCPDSRTEVVNDSAQYEVLYRVARVLSDLLAAAGATKRASDLPEDWVGKVLAAVRGG